jgi:hypothetical protein
LRPDQSAERRPTRPVQSEHTTLKPATPNLTTVDPANFRQVPHRLVNDEHRTKRNLLKRPEEVPDVEERYTGPYHGQRILSVDAYICAN